MYRNMDTSTMTPTIIGSKQMSAIVLVLNFIISIAKIELEIYNATF